MLRRLTIKHYPVVNASARMAVDFHQPIPVYIRLSKLRQITLQSIYQLNVNGLGAVLKQLEVYVRGETEDPNFGGNYGKFPRN